MDRARKAELYGDGVTWARDISRNLNSHTTRLNQAHAYVDSSPPKRLVQTSSSKRTQLKIERQDEIEHENRRLLDKITALSGASVAYQGEARKEKKMHGKTKPSLNQGIRKRESERICKENQLLLRRIQKSKPMINMKEIKKDEEWTIQYLRNASRRRDILRIPKGSTSTLALTHAIESHTPAKGTKTITRDLGNSSRAPNSPTKLHLPSIKGTTSFTKSAKKELSPAPKNIKRPLENVALESFSAATINTNTTSMEKQLTQDAAPIQVVVLNDEPQLLTSNASGVNQKAIASIKESTIENSKVQDLSNDINDYDDDTSYHSLSSLPKDDDITIPNAILGTTDSIKDTSSSKSIKLSRKVTPSQPPKKSPKKRAPSPPQRKTLRNGTLTKESAEKSTSHEKPSRLSAPSSPLRNVSKNSKHLKKITDISIPNEDLSKKTMTHKELKSKRKPSPPVTKSTPRNNTLLKESAKANVPFDKLSKEFTSSIVSMVTRTPSPPLLTATPRNRMLQKESVETCAPSDEPSKESTHTIETSNEEISLNDISKTSTSWKESPEKTKLLKKHSIGASSSPAKNPSSPQLDASLRNSILPKCSVDSLHVECVADPSKNPKTQNLDKKEEDLDCTSSHVIRSDNSPSLNVCDEVIKNEDVESLSKNDGESYMSDAFEDEEEQNEQRKKKSKEDNLGKEDEKSENDEQSKNEEENCEEGEMQCGDEEEHSKNEEEHIEDEHEHSEDEHEHSEDEHEHSEDEKEHSEDEKEHSEDEKEYSEDEQEHSKDEEKHCEDGKEHRKDEEEHCEVGEEDSEDGEEHSEDGKMQCEDGEEHSEDGKMQCEDGEEHSEDEEHSADGEEHSEDGEEHSEDGKMQCEDGEQITQQDYESDFSY